MSYINCGNCCKLSNNLLITYSLNVEYQTPRTISTKMIFVINQDMWENYNVERVHFILYMKKVGYLSRMFSVEIGKWVGKTVFLVMKVFICSLCTKYIDTGYSEEL